MNDLYGLLIILLVIALQHLFSTRENPYWGALLPILYLLSLVYVIMTGILEGNIMKFTLLAVVGEFFLIGYWISGRKNISIKRKKELEKMKIQDI
ncbi:hypothetical protein [Peribacillus sp. NPDC097295]|uniref:hypothetical protein n=1 Tax=Peribacillus sp. NPDC097295 TaxID=3364402 RepID=UPI00380AB698